MSYMKIFMLFALSFLIVTASIAYAANNKTNDNSQAGNSNQSNRGIGQNLSQQIAEKRTEYRSGNFTTSLGQFLNVKEIVSGLLELREGNITVKTNLSLTKVENNKSKLEAELSNGRKAQIKIMPETASETALARLRLKVCNESNNCTIVLKEVGNGNQTKVEYNVQIERHSRILGIFQKKMQVSAEVDAETGAIIGEHKPWWAFIAAEPTE